MTSKPLASGAPQGNGSPKGAKSSVVPDGRLPQDLAGFEIDRDESAPGRGIAQPAGRRPRDRAGHGEGSAALWPEFLSRRRLEVAGLGRRDQRDDVDCPQGVGIQNLVDGIEGNAAPVHAAAGEWEDHGALG